MSLTNLTGLVHRFYCSISWEDFNENFLLDPAVTAISRGHDIALKMFRYRPVSEFGLKVMVLLVDGGELELQSIAKPLAVPGR